MVHDLLVVLDAGVGVADILAGDMHLTRPGERFKLGFSGTPDGRRCSQCAPEVLDHDEAQNAAREPRAGDEKRK